MDIATILGLIGGFSLVGLAMVLGGSPGSFVDVPAILIVFGGTFSVTAICFSIDEVLRAPRVLFYALSDRRPDARLAAIQMLQLAEGARKSGILSLQPAIDRIGNQPFLSKALNMVVDGMPGEEVERILRGEVSATSYRHLRSAGVFRKAAEVAPAMGLIGTLVGLVQMLGNLEDPSTIGPSMAVALLTTFYGAILANMVFSPLATKLERNSEEEVLVSNVYLLAAASIGRQENPRRLEMLLNALLPPAKRVAYFK